MEQSLRQIMTDEIKGYYWLDWSYGRGDHNAAAFNKDYEAWLSSLDADKFLWAYNRVREAINDLN